MKKSIILAAAVAALAMFASCSMEELELSLTGNDLVFTATIDSPATRTTINTDANSEDKGKVSWEDGDEITIKDAANTSVKYVVSSIDDATGKATFTKKSGESGSLGDGPYTATYGPSSLTAQTYSATAGDLPMTAESTTTSLTFSVTCGLLKLNLTKAGVSIKSIKVSQTPYYYTLTCEEAVSIDKGADFYIALPARTYKTFTITDENGKECIINGTTGVTIEANKIQPLKFSEKLVFGVCKTYSATFATIAEGVAAVNDLSTLTLLADVTENVTISKEGETIYFDLNGKTLTGHVSVNSGNVFIKGNGTINAPYSAVSADGTNAVVTIQNGTYTGTETGNVTLIHAVNGGTVNIEDGTYTGAPASGDVKEGKVFYAGANSEADGNQNNHGTINISGGNFSGRISTSNWGVYHISGGTFDRNTVVLYSNPASGASTNTGNTGTLAEAGWIASGYNVVDNGNSTWSVVPAPAVTGKISRTGDIEVGWVQLWPGGPKFAAYNVGAADNAATAYGDYYMWGATETINTSFDGGLGSWKAVTDLSSTEQAKYPQVSGTFDEYKQAESPYFSGTSPWYSKYTGTDDKTVLESVDDAATTNWGSNWRTPTKDEFLSMCRNCYIEWASDYNGVAGVIVYYAKANADKGLFKGASSNKKITSDKTYYSAYSEEIPSYTTSDAHVFFPAAGQTKGTSLNNAGAYSYYMSSTLYVSNSSVASCYYVGFQSGSQYPQSSIGRYIGLPVRPVVAE